MIYDLFYVSTRTVNKNSWEKFKNKFPTSKLIENVSEFSQIKRKAFTKFFWIVWDDLELVDDFDFKYNIPEWDEQYVHIFLNGKNYDGIALVPKTVEITDDSFKYRYYNNTKQIEIVASYPKLYDRFVVKTYDDYLAAKSNSTTDMFWIVWNDVDIIDETIFKFIIDRNNAYELTQNHVFKNAVSDDAYYIGGIILANKSKDISKKEFDKRYLLEKKEHDRIVSRSRYPRYRIQNYEHYLEVVDTEAQKMFWCVWPEITIIDETIFDFYYDPNNGVHDYDRSTNHVFKNLSNDDASFTGGLVLFSIDKPISKKEFDARYLLEKKEHDRIVSRFRYPQYIIKTYDEYLSIYDTVTQPMFWYIPSDVEIIDETVFDLYFPTTDGKYDYDRKISHVFLNDGKYTGVVLFSTEKPISKKEFDSRHIIQRKEWNREVSKSLPYEKFVVDTYEDYLTAKEKSLTEMFWVIPKEIEVIDFNFDLRIPYSDSYNKKINHVFQHRFKNDLTYNGIFLTNTNLTLTKKEIEYRSPVNRKEYQVLASKMRPYDMVFISYNEVNADENYQRLLRRFPRAKRIHGVKGIHQAHIEAAKLVDTDMFWAVDADAVILDDFNFDYEVSRYDRHTVHVWSSQNPVNDLVYGYGGVKLLPTTLTINTDIHSTDMTTSISNKFKSIPDISNITAFNTDPFNTWKSAFRECVKLSSQIIDRQDSEETEQRLNVWTTEGADKLYGEYAIQGANEGRDYGHKYKTDIDQLKKINDFDWLYNYFTEHTKIKTEI